MKATTNCWEILGVAEHATPKEVKKAYRALVKQWHPDRYVHNPQLQRQAETRLSEINQAYNQARVLMAGRTQHSTTGETRSSRTANRHEQRNTEMPWKASFINYALWSKKSRMLRRIAMEMVRDPWVLTAIVLMFGLALLVDWTN